MPNIFRRSIPLRWILLSVAILLALSGGCISYFLVEDQKLNALISGVCSGLFIFALSFLLTWHQYKALDNFRSMGVVKILFNRRDKITYENILSKAKKEVQVMGTSCTRFVDDFANKDNMDHVLLDAMNKNPKLKVRLLAPKIRNMDTVSKQKFKLHKPKIKGLMHDYEGRVEMRHYNFDARHSFVRADNALIVGPVFKDVESQDCPAIYIKTRSPYAKKYLEYYERIWNEGIPIE